MLISYNSDPRRCIYCKQDVLYYRPQLFTSQFLSTQGNQLEDADKQNWLKKMLWWWGLWTKWIRLVKIYLWFYCWLNYAIISLLLHKLANTIVLYCHWLLILDNEILFVMQHVKKWWCLCWVYRSSKTSSWLINWRWRKGHKPPKPLWQRCLTDCKVYQIVVFKRLNERDLDRYAFWFSHLSIFFFQWFFSPENGNWIRRDNTWV